MRNTGYYQKLISQQSEQQGQGELILRDYTSTDTSHILHRSTLQTTAPSSYHAKDIIYMLQACSCTQNFFDPTILSFLLVECVATAMCQKYKSAPLHWDAIDCQSEAGPNIDPDHGSI